MADDKQQMTPQEAEAVLVDFRAALVKLAKAIQAPPTHPQIAAAHARRILPALKALVAGWSDEDPRRGLVWSEVHITTGNRYQPGYTTTPVVVDRWPIPSVGKVERADAFGRSVVVGVRVDAAAGTGLISIQHNPSHRAAEAPRAAPIDRRPVVVEQPRPLGHPPAADGPFEVRGSAAQADLAARTPPGFGRTGRP